MQKTYVLDTNVLLHDAGALGSFPDGEVVITLDVLEELDQFKTASNDLGRAARAVVRQLDGLRQGNNLSQGVTLDSGGSLVVRMDGYLSALPDQMDSTIPDNRILACALALRSDGDREVIFVSKDLNARVKSDALGIQTEDFEPTKVEFDEFYRGYRTVDVPGDQVDGFYRDGSIDAPEDMLPNEFVLLRDDVNPKHTALARFDPVSRRLLPLRFDESHPWNLRALNVEQHFAIELLMDPAVQLVTLMGKAGTGKTLLALAAGLEQVAEQGAVGAGPYHRILVSRPLIPLGRDIGYLPGTKEEKLESWMEPIFDNLKYLVDPKYHDVEDKVGYLFEKGWIEVEAVTYIRGRSLPRLFIIIDEAQNLSPHEVKTIVSRAGRDSKVVLTGDPYQIDNPYLDAASSGLSFLVERFKRQLLFGHVMLDRSERSELARLAAELL